MKITRRQLRSIIRETLIFERKTLASASDVTRFKPQVKDWVEVLLDELSTTTDRWDEVSDKRLENMVRSITDAVISALISSTSGMDYSDQKRHKDREEEKSHQKWDKKRRATRGSGARYYGDYGVSV
tara:strand:+ start:824 stop:1204 length:381 start_codon:yes stop_codon:yes gene_type:complete